MWRVSDKEQGISLLAFVYAALDGVHSKKALKHAIEKNACDVNGAKVRFASRPLNKGDIVSLQLDFLQNEGVYRKIHSYDPKRILFEDDHLLIYNKPQGIATDQNGLIAQLHLYNPSLLIVHRLDKETTGAIIFAKDPYTLQKMISLFRKKNVRKSYLAIVDGVVESKVGIIENYLGRRHQFEGQCLWGEVSKEKGTRARTDWQLLKHGNNASLLLCTPITGKTHQIRVHLSSISHPILGDYQYAMKFQCQYSPLRYLLHAYRLEFVHPYTQKQLFIEVPPPEDFLAVERTLFDEGKVL